MKKIITTFLVFIAFAFNVKAQVVCDGGCQPVGSPQQFIETLCMFEYHHNVNGIQYDISIPAVIVMVNYTIMDCGGNSTIQIDGTCLIDQRDYIENSLLGFQITNDIACNFSVNNSADIKQAQIDAINKLVTSLGIPAQVDVYFKGSCNSLVKCRWPAGSFIVLSSTGDTPGTRVINLSNTTFYQAIPCNEICCKISYTYIISYTENGLTEYTWKPSTISEEHPEECENSTPPDFSTFPNKIKAKSIDPITGDTIDVEGIFENQEPCEPICNKFMAPGLCKYSFVTDVVNPGKKELPLELSANPTLVNSFIKFTSNKPIKKVMVFDMSGKKVMNVILTDNNELNTTELKQGMYFVQVYISDNEVKTIKVVKE